MQFCVECMIAVKQRHYIGYRHSRDQCTVIHQREPNLPENMTGTTALFIYLSSLPSWIKSHFNFLKTSSLTLTINEATVCRRWYNLAINYGMYSRIVIKDERPQDAM
ncbi:hypothetical protein MAM1_0079d04480 [Mucor ambiguus]|uniref:F-box domain-containing protein n=1 Tax=Mucor ambiguus TaxID=91626 RepID=A0A0C9MP13_9FUNG|nr:hypothetical protein MAM1_0079d04480 [Mucor ambiguus]